MNLNKNIVLLGMMGSGKSTIGFLLSKKINCSFLDVDKFIEKETNLKIHDIFQKKGENYFRDIEEKITLKLLKNKGKVISLGGGGFLNKNIRKEILKNQSKIADIETNRMYAWSDMSKVKKDLWNKLHAFKAGVKDQVTNLA